jgi:hypothetical protein
MSTKIGAPRDNFKPAAGLYMADRSESAGGEDLTFRAHDIVW